MCVLVEGDGGRRKEREEEGAGGGRSGCSTKNKNPTRQCGELKLNIHEESALTSTMHVAAHLTQAMSPGQVLNTLILRVCLHQLRSSH